MATQPDFEKARSLIYRGHDEDPNKFDGDHGQSIPYETHYARKMEKYLSQRANDPSDVLKLAVCGQHFKRWEVPRGDYPMTKLGYHSWRTHLKKRQARLVSDILKESGYTTADQERCIALIEKQGLNKGEAEVQILEDVACLVFIDDQFDEFKDKHDEQKIIDILRKTWVKMSKEGQDLAMGIPMTDDCRALVEKALSA